MEYKEDTAVYASNGAEVGHIDRVVVDPEKNTITHIVVRKGFLFKEDKVVPIGLIADATDERINLRGDAGDLDKLPLFEEKHYVPANDGGGTEAIGQPLAGMPGADTVGRRARFIKQIEQHIPEGTVALKEGAKVVTSEGKHVGNVERVIAEAEPDRATHLLVSK